MESIKTCKLPPCNLRHITYYIKSFCLLVLFFSSSAVFAQYSGVGVVDPTNALHVRPQGAEDPVKIEGLNAGTAADTKVLVTDPSTGVIKTVDASSFSDNQELTFNALTSTLTLERGGTPVVLSGLGGNLYTVNGTLADNRAVTQNNFDLNFDANTLVVSGDDNRVGIGTNSPNSRLDVAGRTITQNFTMTNGAANGRILRSDAAGNASWVLPSTVFSSTNTDNQSIRNLVFSGTTLTVGIERGSSQTVSLAALADNQSIRNLGLSGTTLTVGIEDGSSQTVNLSSLSDNLGNHRLTQNLQTRGNWISTFGGSEGIFVESGGNVGIGINNPTADLHVVGTALVTNMPARTSDAFIVSSDAIGNLRRVSWANASASFGDDLGNHTATTTLNMNSRDASFTTGNVNFGSSTRQMLNLFSTSYGIGVQSNTLYNRSSNGFAWYRGGAHSNSMLNAGGGTLAMSLNNNSKLTVNGEVEFQGFLRADGGNNVINTGSGFIHINNDEHYTNGVFTPGDFRADGRIFFNEDGDDSDIRAKSATGDVVFFVDASNNNVGIGTESPTSGVKLDVNGTARVRTMAPRTSDAFVVSSDASGNLRKVSWADAATAFEDNLGDHQLDQNLETRNQWLSNDGDAEGMMISATNGYVGVNMSPSAPMTIEANGNNNAFQNGLYVYNPDSAGDDGDAMIAARTQGTNGGDPVLALGILGGQSWSIGVDNSDSDKLKFSNSFNDVASAVSMTLTNQDRLGIGTTDPDATLHVVGNNATLVFGRSGSILMEVTRSNIGVGSSAYSYIGTAVTTGNAASIGYFNQGNNNADSRLEFGFRGDERLMIIERNGNVGIGTISPVRKLEVSQIGNGNPFVASTSPNLIKIASTGNGSSSGIILEARNAGGNVQSYAIGVNPNFSGGLLTMTNETGQDFFGYVRSTGDVYTNSISGNLGVGTRAPTRKLHVIGDIFATGTVTSSDSTLKSNIEKYTVDALAQIRRLNPVTYHWKNSAQDAEGYSDRQQIGFLAQEVKSVIPEAVSGEEGNGMGIDYSKITPVVVKAMQEQQVQIETQQMRIDKLEAELKEIKELLKK